MDDSHTHDASVEMGEGAQTSQSPAAPPTHTEQRRPAGRRPGAKLCGKPKTHKKPDKTRLKSFVLHFAHATLPSLHFILLVAIMIAIVVVVVFFVVVIRNNLRKPFLKRGPDQPDGRAMLLFHGVDYFLLRLNLLL